MKPWHYLASFLVPALAALGLTLGGPWAWMTVAGVFIAIPSLDAWFGVQDGNWDDPTAQKARGNRFYSIILYAHLPIQILLILYLGYVWNHSNAPWLIRLGWVLSVMLSTGGIGITVAHELIHRKTSWERWIGKWILMTVLYMHFAIEHVRGHHAQVATENDPASAPQGMNVYRFILGTIPAQWLSAWHLEAKRLKKHGRSNLSFRNEMLWYVVIQASWLALITYLFGISFLPAYLAVASLSFLLLEIINYVEHYGLRRHRADHGRWEAVSEAHSWNSNHRVSRMMLFELSRHSDHHMSAEKPYQILRTEEASPQMPNGYPGMVLLALVPPLWFSIMDRRLPQATNTTGSL
ncbi:MAG: alkane 1-monooxygenase [Pirellula sp.]